MKSFKHLFAVCMLLLVATTATAQSQSDNTQTKAVSATKADVNGDGVVNEADIEEIIAIIKENNDVKYYWYVGNSEDIVKGDLAAGDIDWSKAQQVTSFDELNYSTDGTKITMVNSGNNSVYILCPKSWSNKWQFWNVGNDIDLTGGLQEVGEILETTFVKDCVEYDLWWFDGYYGNIAHIRKKIIYNIMAKLTYADNGIILGDIKTIGHKTGGFAGKANYTVDGSNANSLKGGEIDTAIQSFNAIDIDRNGANLGSYIINTTGQLLSH